MGAELALSARSEGGLKELALEVGQRCLVLPLDVSDEISIGEAFDQLREKWGRVDRIIYLSAVYVPMSLDRLDSKEVSRLIDINVKGVFYLLAQVLPFLLEQDKAQIVLYASSAGYLGLPGGQPYSASKSAMISLAESLRAELPKRVDVKVINSGFVDTALTKKNDFDMPMIMSAQQAAQNIAKSILKSGFEIHFPKRFTYLLKILRLCPYWLYFFLMSKSHKRHKP